MSHMDILHQRRDADTGLSTFTALKRMDELAESLARQLDATEKRIADNSEPTTDQVAAAVLAFQEYTEHKTLNINTATFMVAMVKSIEAALKVQGGKSNGQ